MNENLILIAVMVTEHKFVFCLPSGFCFVSRSGVLTALKVLLVTFVTSDKSNCGFMPHKKYWLMLKYIINNLCYISG